MKKPRIGIIVQARMGSTRLPAKVMQEILGQPMLLRVMERLKAVALADVLIIATAQTPENNPIVELAQRANVKIFRGSEADVLRRYYETAKENKLDVVTRVTSDCPLIDPRVVDEGIQYFLDHQPIDYVSNTLERTFPRGMDTEVFSFAILKKANDEADQPYQREHVTPYILEKGRALNYSHKKNLSKYRLTVDTAEDFALIVKIYEALYSKNKLFDLEAIVQFLEKNPRLLELNKNVKQKVVK